MLEASILSAITDALTELIGDHGIYAVFVLMFVDAVLPAASELVMVYAGAVAAGAFAGQSVVLFGEPIESNFWAYVAMASPGTLGYILGSIAGWAIGYYGGRPFVERRGRWLHVTPHTLDRAERWFDRFGDWAVAIGRVTPVVRSFIAIPAGVFRMPLGRYTLLTIPGSVVWASRSRAPAGRPARSGRTSTTASATRNTSSPRSSSRWSRPESGVTGEGLGLTGVPKIPLVDVRRSTRR